MVGNEYLELLPDPLDTVKKLDAYVIGQDVAKKNLGIMLLSRSLLKLQKNGHLPSNVNIQKSNLLLIGPTGSGKTQLIRALSEISDIPILIKDVTGITSGGYIGGKVEDILIAYTDLIYDWVKARPDSFWGEIEAQDNSSIRDDVFYDTLESGIIYIDEVDKLLSNSGNRDITGDMVQNELLKILEGDEVDLTQGRKDVKPRCGLKSLNTKYISFVCGGAFSGLTDIIHQRLSTKSTIGFTTEINQYSKEKDQTRILNKVRTEDLVAYGFKSEFLGRLPLVAQLSELDEVTMCRIITEPKNAIYKRYQDFFKLFNIDLRIDSRGIKEIANRAMELKLGARSLQQIFNTLFIDDLAHIFELRDSKLKISRSTVIERLG